MICPGPISGYQAKNETRLKISMMTKHFFWKPFTHRILRHFWMCHVTCYYLPKPRPRSKELGHWEKESRCSLSQNGPLPTRRPFVFFRNKKKGEKGGSKLRHTSFFFSSESKGYLGVSWKMLGKTPSHTNQILILFQ